MDDLLFGLQITVLGMGIVFGLLALLWVLLTLVLRLERRGASKGAAEAVAAASTLAPAIDELPEVGPSGSPAVRLVGVPADLDPDLLAAIGVVILRHADTRRRQAAPAMRTNWPGSLLFASRWVAAGRARQARSWTRRGR